ncbi:MAG: DUF4197 domain-containing protein [Burkholderiales bacterium]|nr:DUF4197 domain-containing protein [Burkholderiales bacterium]
MQRRQFTSMAVAAWALPLGARAAGLGEADAALGVRTALERGAEAAVSLLGQRDGFLGNAKVRIPLPGALKDAEPLLRLSGQQHRVDELVTAMNRAAEAAVPHARELLVDAVRRLSVADAVRIVRGDDTAVTAYFERSTREPLSGRFLPIVTRETERVDLASKYNAVAARASGLGLVKPEDANIASYVTRKALDGLYWMIGEEEKKIRRDPVGTGSDILRRVFGG